MYALLILLTLFFLSAFSIILRKVYIEKPLIDFNSITNHHVLRTRSIKSTKREYTLFGFLTFFSLVFYSLFLVFANQNLGSLVFFICVFLTSYFLFIWLPNKKPGGLSVSLANYLSPIVIALLTKTKKTTKGLEDYLKLKHDINKQAKPMTKTEIIDILKTQKELFSGKSLGRDLLVAINSTNLTSKSIGEEMQQLVDLQVIDSHEQIGPILIDELHKTGRKVFLVNDKEEGLVGFVNLSDLTGLKKEGKIISALKHNLEYLKIEDNVLEALAQFVETGSKIFVVVDNANEPVGVIHVEDLVAKIINEPEN